MSNTNTTQDVSSGFAQTLQALGIHPSEVENGKVVRRPIIVNSLDHFKDIFGAKTNDETTKKHLNNLTTANAAAFNDTTETHLLTRLQAHINGDYPLSASDQTLAAKYFPVKVMVEAATTLTIDTPRTYGPSSSPAVLTCDNLLFKDAGSITTLNNLFTLNANSVTVGPLSGGKPFLINILGVKGASGANGTNGTNQTTAAGNGASSTVPTPGICTGATSSSKGDDGSVGGNATSDGLPGNDGLPNLQANINILNSLTGNLPIFTQSGAGGQGGAGGAGGVGQAGGNGGNGCNSGCECTDASNGGNGGNGGNGSNGGNGGNGVRGNDSFVVIPSNFANLITTGSDSAAPGLGGAPGAAGNGGKGGAAGTTGTKHCANGSAGKDGVAGSVGSKSGSNGTGIGAPGTIHIN